MNYKLFFIIFLFNQSVLASTSEKVFKEFSGTKSYSFEEVVTDKTLAVLFQPNCSACRKQIKNIGCLSDMSDKIILVGSFGNEEKVKRSYLKKKTKLKGYYIEKENLNKIGFEDFLSPQVIFYSVKKNLQFLGYKSCKRIKEKIKEVLSDD